MNEWKIEVKNEEESRLVQEKAFRLGYFWSKSRKTVCYLDKRFLFFWADGAICHGSNDEEYFRLNKFPQISISDFLALPEPEPSPKYRTDFRVGDEVTMIIHGKVDGIKEGSNYPILSSFGFTFALDGRHFLDYSTRTLYHGHIPIPESATRTLETEPEIKELTLSEIAEKLSDLVEQLRIKDGEK